MQRKIFIALIAIIAIVIISIGSQSDSKSIDFFADQKQGKSEPLAFLSVKGNKIINEKGREIKLRGFHYDCFYVFRKNIHDAIKSSNDDPDQFNIELSKYYFTDEDIREIKAMGANVIRIGFRVWEIEKKPYSYSEKSLKHLDNTIAKWGKNGIYVILDLHAAGQNRLPHNREYGNVLWNDMHFQDRVIALWGMIANRYKDNPYIAGYDIINEPQAPTKEALHSFYQKSIQKIRETDEKHILFIERNLFNTKKIQFGGEYNDPNIALSFHFYRPAKFTNQGRRGRPSGYKYPAKYGGVYWDKNQINKYFTGVLAKIKDRPLFIGEFSAIVWSGGEDALQYNKDVIEVMNSKGIHYTFFVYKFTIRRSRGYYRPREDTQKRIIAQANKLIKRKLKLRDLTDNDKRLHLSINFTKNEKLIQILKEGFLKTD